MDDCDQWLMIHSLFLIVVVFSRTTCNGWATRAELPRVVALLSENTFTYLRNEPWRSTFLSFKITLHPDNRTTFDILTLKCRQSMTNEFWRTEIQCTMKGRVLEVVAKRHMLAFLKRLLSLRTSMGSVKYIDFIPPESSYLVLVTSFPWNALLWNRVRHFSAANFPQSETFLSFSWSTEIAKWKEKITW